MPSLSELLKRSASASDITAHVDALTPRQRVQQCLAVAGRQLPGLYESMRGHLASDVATLASPPKQTVIYELRNSLPVFNVAQKRFYRPDTGEVIGYNHTGALASLTGPGYFFALDGDDGEIVFDYTRLPDLRPPGWPAIRPNTGLIAGATYSNMIDYVRAVSSHTFVGAAFRRSKPRHAYFLLTRAVEGAV